MVFCDIVNVVPYITKPSGRMRARAKKYIAKAHTFLYDKVYPSGHGIIHIPGRTSGLTSDKAYVPDVV